MNCRELTSFLMEYFAGELPPQVSGEFESHLSGCGNCHTFLAQYKETIALGHGAAHDVRPQVPEELIQAIMAALKTAEQDS